MRKGSDLVIQVHYHPSGKAEVDRMTKRRDAITAQLASLRDVVAGFGDDDSGDGKAKG